MLLRQALLFLSACAAASAQQAVDPRVLAGFRGIAEHNARLLPMLDQVRAKEWVSQGAPETYAAQLEAARRQIQAIGSEMAALAQRPESIQECLKALFRVEAFHVALDSLLGGLRRYQNPALAELIQSVAAEDQADMARIQEYVLQLEEEREQQYQVVEHEAQRCRADLSKGAPGKTP
jgi:hypothetical protein